MGKFTDDDLMQIEGDYDKFVGRVQERYGDKKDEIVRWADGGTGGRGNRPHRSVRLSGLVDVGRLNDTLYE